LHLAYEYNGRSPFTEIPAGYHAKAALPTFREDREAPGKYQKLSLIPQVFIFHNIVNYFKNEDPFFVGVGCI
jgi:hypothetical protein